MAVAVVAPQIVTHGLGRLKRLESGVLVPINRIAVATVLLDRSYAVGFTTESGKQLTWIYKNLAEIKADFPKEVDTIVIDTSNEPQRVEAIIKRFKAYEIL